MVTTTPAHDEGQNPPRKGAPGTAYRVPRPDAINPAEQRLRRLDRLAWILDRSIPIGNRRIGLDPIIGLLPGLGDWIGAMLSVYVLYEGARLGAPKHILVRMTGNILIETIVGAVPLLGDLFDFAWQANTRNVALIRKHHGQTWSSRSLRGVWLVVLGVAVLVLTLIAALGILLFRAIVNLNWSGT